MHMLPSPTETVKEALSKGIRYFDTAPHYGNGLAEERLGRALPPFRAAPPEKEKSCSKGVVRVSTKVGRYCVPETKFDKTTMKPEWRYNGTTYKDQFVTKNFHSNVCVVDYTAEGIVKNVLQSVERLVAPRLHPDSVPDYMAQLQSAVTGVSSRPLPGGRPPFDVLRLHDAEEEETFSPCVGKGGGLEALGRLKSAGVCSEVSLGMGDAVFARRLMESCEQGLIDNVMIAGVWNLLNQEGLEFLIFCQERGVKIHLASVFASGALWGGDRYNCAPMSEEIQKKVQGWRELCEKHKAALPRVALEFALLPEVVELVAIGCATVEEVRQNSALWEEDSGSTVPVSLWKEAMERGLLRKDFAQLITGLNINRN
uniref:NADP-dependent oxidoreductase domain-containing protein n=1 Tax=Chromera velia CCMP2878 TaxID=1169474 RepID=A0A0G4G581_9ALVE|eukprot:Cvel_4178.t1-p1 / transcript=Cvel_4178.t1 / gene=Cvel_4178 / organism=Chromera_velia_CCMP2878 / gene_product=Pyridoxal 4-dehydrogenase, putative / transcript_product=Pyridoxal 4-dehydrogenase, putative / location=Cvel_scaffold180:41642-43339(-) / protein_length=369 / sequence_SO=supercontig / SO=protein_coding / is_pseudo=false